MVKPHYCYFLQELPKAVIKVNSEISVEPDSEELLKKAANTAKMQTPSLSRYRAGARTLGPIGVGLSGHWFVKQTSG